jgi:tetratricopeptide (TPR) repeat protein
MATFLEAARLARRTGVSEHLARAALGYGGRLPWTRPGNDQVLIPVLQEALVMLGGSDDRLRVRLLARLACAWRSSPEQREQSAAFTRQAVDLARGLDDPATLTYALAGRFWATWWPENPMDRRRVAEEMLAVAESVGEPERLIDAHLMLWLNYSEVGDMTDARAKAEEVRRLAEDLRQPYQLWLGVAPRAELALLEGEFTVAEELMRGEEWGRPITLVRDEVSAARFHLFLLRREQDRLAEAEALVRSAADEFPWYPLHRAALAVLLADLGRVSEARAVFAELSADGFRAIYRDNMWLLGMCLASEACAILGDAARAAVLYQQLLPFAGRHAIGHAEGSVGSVDRYLGLLAATQGDVNAATRHLEDAVRTNEQMGAHPWTAHTQHDLAQVLARRDAPGDRERAGSLEQAALVAAQRMGMSALARGISASLGEESALPHLEQAVAGTGMFRREGDYWSVGIGGDRVRIRDAKGMRYLARLLSQPAHEIHALQLAGSAAAATAVRAGRDELETGGLGDAGALLDAEAKAAYRHRIEELRGELAEAQEWNDSERTAKARAELDFLAHEFARAVGIGGTDRKAASASERARLSVTRAIRSAIARIQEESPALGAHLAATVRTGSFCSYTPDPRVPIHWQL